MGQTHDWTAPKSDVTDELIYDVAKIIVTQIQQTPGGVWIARVPDVMQLHGQTDPEEYGTYLTAITHACRRYNIQWDKAGRNGRKYTMIESDMAAFLAQQSVRSGKYSTELKVTLTCPCCNTPTTYEVEIRPTASSSHT